MEAKDPAVHDGVAVLLVQLLDGGRLDDVPRLLDDVELHEAVVPLVLLLDGRELLVVQTVDVADVPQPGVEQSEVLGRHGGLDAAAAVVAADDDVLDVQVADRVVDHGHDVEVGGADQVGDVAVDEHLAGFEAGDGFGGDARVGAAWGVSAPSGYGLLYHANGEEVTGTYRSKDTRGSVRRSASRRTRDASSSAPRPTSCCSQRCGHGSAASTCARSACRLRPCWASASLRRCRMVSWAVLGSIGRPDG